jgi:hypothetical protein
MSRHKRAGRAGGSTFLRDLESHQLQRLEARVSVLPHDEMVVHGDAERARDLDDRPRHVDVGARGGGIAGGVVVHDKTRADYHIDVN